MTNEEKMALLKAIAVSIFAGKLSGTDVTKDYITDQFIVGGRVNGRWFKESLRGYDLDINTGKGIISIRCVEQNPNKMDNNGNLKWTANLARQGNKIMWVIDRNGGFLGRIHDGEWVAGFEPAIQPAVAEQVYHPINANAAVAENNIMESMDTNELPEIPGNKNIPDYILESIADMDEPPDDWEEY